MDLGYQRIEHSHFTGSAEQLVGERGADETCPAGDENSPAHPHRLPIRAGRASLQ
jgi:hypothetical protein